jgi:hypothetical protein
MTLQDPPLGERPVDVGFRAGARGVFASLFTRTWARWFASVTSEMKKKVFSAYDAAGEIDVSGGETDITLDTEGATNAAFSHGDDEAEIAFNESGDFEVTICAGAYTAANKAICIAEFKLQVNTGGGYADAGGTIIRIPMALEAVVGGSCTGTKSIVTAFSAGDIIKMTGKRIAGGDTVKTLADSCSISIKKWS